MDQSHMMRPVQLSDTYYYGIQPTICKVAAEMDDMSVAYPTQAMFDPMLDRVYDEIMNMYPEEMQSQAANCFEQNIGGVNAPSAYNSDYHIEQFPSPFRRRRFFRDLLGVLLLQELFRRRRRRF